MVGCPVRGSAKLCWLSDSLSFVKTTRGAMWIVLSVGASFFSCTTERATTSPSSRPIPESPKVPLDLFRRDQPAIGDLFQWNDQLIVRTHEYFSIDVATGSIIPLQIEGIDTISALVMRGQNRALAFGKLRGEYVLQAKEEVGWTSWPIPEAVRIAKSPYLICASGHSIVLLNWRHGYRMEHKGTTNEIVFEIMPLENLLPFVQVGQPKQCFLVEIQYFYHSMRENLEAV